jgi:hypothetical protein
VARGCATVASNFAHRAATSAAKNARQDIARRGRRRQKKMSDADKLDAIIGRFIQATDAARNELVDEIKRLGYEVMHLKAMLANEHQKTVPVEDRNRIAQTPVQPDGFVNDYD